MTWITLHIDCFQTQINCKWNGHNSASEKSKTQTCRISLKYKKSISVNTKIGSTELPTSVPSHIYLVWNIVVPALAVQFLPYV